MITDNNYFLSECNQVQLRLPYKSNHDHFMITYDYFPCVTLFLLLVGEFIPIHVASLCDLQRNMNEMCSNKWVILFSIFILLK